MSLLYRTGSGRNNIAWGGGSTSAATYLRRSGSGRNDCSYIWIGSNGTWNLLNRWGGGRNDINWGNVSFNFASGLQLFNLKTVDRGWGYTYNVQVRTSTNLVTLFFSQGNVQPNAFMNGAIRANVVSRSNFELAISIDRYSSTGQDIASFIKSNYSTVTFQTDLGNYSFPLNTLRVTYVPHSTEMLSKLSITKAESANIGNFKSSLNIVFS